MVYAPTSDITRYLPPEAFDVRPLEYEWAEATNAIIFASSVDYETFSAWESGLSHFYLTLVGVANALNVESDPELGCISFWLQSAPPVDIHVARCKNTESVETLNAWIGSTLLSTMASDNRAATIGLIRIRPV